MSKFKVGDKVRVRANLKDFDLNEEPCITEEMLNYTGKEFIIKSIYRNEYYLLNKADGWGWNEKWLEPVNATHILDDVEFNYLLNIIKPFKDKVKGIKKEPQLCFPKEYIKENIQIYMNSGEVANLPSFDEGTMYKGMEFYRLYTLEELGFVKLKKKIGDAVCTDEISCEDCPLGCTSCKHTYADPMPTLFEQLEITLKDYPQLEQMREYLMNELNKEIKEKC